MNQFKQDKYFSMNPHNPLLNRLYESKTGKKQNRPLSLKDELSNKDKILVPKFQTKKAIEPPIDLSQRQKTTILKPNKTLLPSLTAKQPTPAPSTKKTTFRQRKISFKEHGELLYFPTELSFDYNKKEEEEREIKREYSMKKIATPALTEPAQLDQAEEEELFEYLKVIEDNVELNEQFCYMNRGEMPYSYRIVEYEEVNKNQFLTVSLRGVSIFKNGENEFTTVDKLAKEVELYRKIKKIQFFKDYIKDKVMRHWKYRSVRRKFEMQCRLAGKKFFMHNPILQEYLLFLHAHADSFSKCKFLNLRISQSQDLAGLKALLHQVEEEVEKSILYFDKTISVRVKETISKNKAKFRQEERVTLGQEIKEEGFLPFDSKKKPMKYTQMAKIKQFEGNNFRLLKMTDFIRFNTKIEMIRDGLVDFNNEMKGLHEKYLKRRETTFVSWTMMSADISEESSELICTPTVDEIQNLLLDHKKRIFDQIFRKHYLLIERKDEFDCESVQLPEQMPSKLDIKFYFEQNQHILQLRKQLRESADVCFSDIHKVIDHCDQVLIKIYQASGVTRKIEDYMQNQVLKDYLEAYSFKKKILAEWEPVIEFGIVYLDTTEVLRKVNERFEAKYKRIASAIPAEVMKRCEELATKITGIYNMFKQNPSNVSEYISFNKNYLLQKNDIANLEQRIEAILELEEMVFKNGLRIGENSKIHIAQCSTYFRELSKRLEEIEGDEEKDRKKFQKAVDDMVDPLDERAEELYKKIYEDGDVSNSQFSSKKCLERLENYNQEFQKIKNKKEDLFHYQKQLGMGHKDLPNYFKCQTCLFWLITLWQGKVKFEEYENFTKTKGYKQTLKLDIDGLIEFNNNIEKASSDIEQVELLQNFKQQAQRIFKVIQMCRLLGTETLQDEHFKSIHEKLIIKDKRTRDYLFTIEGGRTILCDHLVRETNLMEIREQLEEIVFISQQESIIKKNLLEIDEFWKKNKIAVVVEDLARNGSEIYHLGRQENEELQEKIGSFLITFKNILGSKHSVGDLNQKVLTQINICEYLKQLIEKWVQVQKQWVKMLPIMANYSSVKHQSNVYFQFTSVDTTLKKMNRQMFDLPLKRVVEDYKDKKHLNVLLNCERDMREVNKTFNNFLQIKRNTYHRFFFLADQELITILEKTKDGKTLASYAGMCFNCDRLVLDKQLISGFETKTEVFKLRKTIIRGEPDEMFKSLEENMKNSLKFGITGLLPKMKITMNIDLQHKQYSLQAILVADKLLWTEMTELYLNQNSYASYETVLRRPCEQLANYNKKYELSQDLRSKIAIRLVQMMHLREMGMEMVRDQISKDDFKWKEQLKYTIEDEQIYLTQFNKKFQYGLEYYPPQKITVPTANFKRLLTQAHNTSVSGDKILLVKGLEGEGKRNLVKSCASQFGIYYKQLICNKNISLQYIMRFVQGAISAGAWLSFYEFQHLDNSVAVKLLYELKRIVKSINNNTEDVIFGDPRKSHKRKNSALNSQEDLDKSATRKKSVNMMGSEIPAQISMPNLNHAKTIIKSNNRVLFNFITHGMNPQKISIYQFDTQVLAEPNCRKICEWLLQCHNFEDYEHLSARLILFLETVFPFLERVMGSFIGILRKIIGIACTKKNLLVQASTRKLTMKDDFDIFAQTFKQEVIDKSDQNIHSVLFEALHAYFGSDLEEFYTSALPAKTSKKTSPERIRKQSISINTKLTVLRNLMENPGVKNILVIGPRTNKSQLIEESCQLAERPLLSIYPQSCEYFFNDDVIEFLNKLEKNVVLKYDGESIIREWSDLVISGYLLVQGKKIYLKNKTVIMELREVINCSPSFVGSCQIVYVGNTMTKKEKFLQRSAAEECDVLMESVYQIFGDQLEVLPDHLLEILAQLLKPYALNPQSKNYHKLITWLATIIGVENLWNKYYGGRYFDLTVSKFSQELVNIDESRYMPVEEHTNGLNGCLLIHTKSTILYYEFFKNLMQASIPILMCGNYNCGKSTIVKLLLNHQGIMKKRGGEQDEGMGMGMAGGLQPSRSDHMLHAQSSKVHLPIKQASKRWNQILKSNLTQIRREGKNLLVNIGEKDIIVTVDDLDLGSEWNREYIRQILDTDSIRDNKFDLYKLEKVKILAAWHYPSQHLQSPTRVKDTAQSKLLDRMLEIQLPIFNRDSLHTIVKTNLETFTKKHNMNKEVIAAIDSKVVKAMLIVFDDLTNVNGQNEAASVTLGVLRNLLSLPKKNYFTSAENYISFFRYMMKVRTMQRCFNSKLVWQYSNVLENVNKVMFSENKSAIQSTIPVAAEQKSQEQEEQEEPSSALYYEESQIIYQDKQFKQIQLKKIKSSIEKAFPFAHIFPEMLEVVLRLNNQLHCIDGNCILLGRNGTGKKTILKIAASLNKIHLCQSASEGLYQCYRGKHVIFVESYLRSKYTQFITTNKSTVYSQMLSIDNDEELEEKFMTAPETRKQYREIKSNNTALLSDDEGASSGSNRLVKKMRSKMKNVIILDNTSKYKQVINQFREINRYFVCYIDEWPTEALLTISGTHIEKMEAESGKSEKEKEKEKQEQKRAFSINKILAEVYTTANRITQTYDDSSLSIKKFQEFVKIYNFMFGERNKKLSRKVEFYTKIYSKFHEACNMILQWEARVDILRIELQEMIEKLDEELSKNRQEELTFSVLHQKLSQEDEIIMNKNAEMREVKREMENQLTGMKRVMSNIEKIVGAMQRSEMSEMKKIYKNSKVVGFGLECLCLLLGDEPTQKSINKILADPNLMMKMKSQNILSERNSRVEEKWKVEHEGIEEELKSKHHTETSKIIIEWIKVVLEYWVVSEEHKTLNSKYKTYKDIFERSVREQAKLEEQIQELKNKTLEVNKQFAVLFKEKDKALKEFNSISTKIRNAEKLVPALRKSENQTWEMVKEVRDHIDCLAGDLILSTACLVYLPLRRLKPKKQLIEGIKKLLTARLISYHDNFMEPITKVQDAVLEDLNFIALNQLFDCPMLIVDPQRRATNFIFELNSGLANSIEPITGDKEENIFKKEEKKELKDIKEEPKKEEEDNEETTKKQVELAQPDQFQESQYHPRKQKIYLLTEEARYKQIVQKLPENTITIDWKYISLNTNEKIFLKLAEHKKPEYFLIKNELNRKIKKDQKKIEEYKRLIYEKIEQEDIKVLDDNSFIDIGMKLMELEVETEKNRQLEKEKVKEISDLAQEINQEVEKVIFMVTALKKIRNVALDIILDIACSPGNTIENVIKWVLCILPPQQRIGWLLSIVLDFEKQGNEELFGVLVRDVPLKANEGLRTKKPGAISPKNFESICRLLVYSPNLKNFCEAVIKSPRQFELWTYESSSTPLPSNFKPECLHLIEQLAIVKLFKPKTLAPLVSKILAQSFPFTISQYQNSELLQRINPKFPILAKCSMKHLKELCYEFNQGKMTTKCMMEIENEYEMRKLVWKEMEEGSWLILHSVCDTKNRQKLEDLVEYVMNYDQQENFRVFIFLDQREDDEKTKEEVLIMDSKYIENIAVIIYEESANLNKLMEMNPYAVRPQSQQSEPEQEKGSKNLSMAMSQEREKNIIKKLWNFCMIADTIATVKYPQFRFYNNLEKIVGLLRYLHEYAVPLEFNVSSIAEYIGSVYCRQLEAGSHKDMREVMERIIDETRLYDKGIYGVPTEPAEGMSAKIRNNYQVLGFDQSYLQRRNQKDGEHILEILGRIHYHNRNVRDEIPEIRSVLTRTPNSPITFNRDFKNKDYLHCYTLELQRHNAKILALKQFIEWVNIASNKDEKDAEEEKELTSANQKEEEDGREKGQEKLIDSFNWPNLLGKMGKLVGWKVGKNKVRAALAIWVNNLKKKHEFLLYWNLDSNVFVLQPVLLDNFHMLLSIYTIRYLNLNYNKIKQESESLGKNILYSLQLEFTRQTDQKQLYMPEGILLPDLIYHEFKYNFELKMLDSNVMGEEPVGLLMLKMKKIVKAEEEKEDYESPPVHIAKRVNGRVELLYRVRTYIDGHFPEWEMRKPMLISE